MRSACITTHHCCFNSAFKHEQRIEHMLWLCWAHGHAAWHAFDLLQSINQSINSINSIDFSCSKQQQLGMCSTHNDQHCNPPRSLPWSLIQNKCEIASFATLCTMRVGLVSQHSYHAYEAVLRKLYARVANPIGGAACVLPAILLSSLSSLLLSLPLLSSSSPCPPPSSS